MAKKIVEATSASISRSSCSISKGKQPVPIVKNEKIAQVFGDDDDDDVIGFLLNFFFII